MRGKKKIILGLDPGIHLTGFGFISVIGEKMSVLNFGVITTPASLPLYSRLKMMVDDLRKLCAQYHPMVCAMEKIFFAKNTKTALKVAEARGALIYFLTSRKISIYEYTPLQVKVALTGYGRAHKSQMQKIIQLIFKFKNLPTPDDSADALAVALCHLQSERLGNRLESEALRPTTPTILTTG